MEKTFNKNASMLFAFYCAALLSTVIFISHIFLITAFHFLTEILFPQNDRLNEMAYYVEYLFSSIIFPCIALGYYLRAKASLFVIHSIARPCEKVGVTTGVIVRLFWGMVWRAAIVGILPAMLIAPIESAYGSQLHKVLELGLPLMYLPRIIQYFVSMFFAFWWLFVSSHGQYRLGFLSDAASCNKLDSQ